MIGYGPQVVNGDNVEGIHHRHGQDVFLYGKGYGHALPGHTLGDKPHDLGVDEANLAGRHVRDVKLLGEGGEDLDLVGKAHLNDDIPQQAPLLPLAIQGLVELFLGDHLVVDQQGTQRFVTQGIALGKRHCAIHLNFGGFPLIPSVSD